MSKVLRPVFVAAALVALLGNGGRAESNGDDRYAVAARHYADGRWQFAVEEFQQLLQSESNHARKSDAMFYLGEALLQLERHDDARDCFNKLLAQDPNGRRSRQALFRCGETALFAGDHEKARAALESFSRQYPDDSLGAYALAYRGEIELAARRAEEAQRLFDESLRAYPNGPLADQSRLGAARALSLLEKWDDACRHFAQLTQRADYPFADEAQYQLGQTLALAGRHAEAAEALAAFEATYKASPRRDGARLARTTALSRIGRFDEARELAQTLADHPELRTSARMLLAAVLTSQEKNAEAARLLEELLETKLARPQLAQCQARMAICRARLNQFEDAQKYYSALAKDDASAELTRATARQLAELAYAAGKENLAAELFATLTDGESQSADAAAGLSGLAWSQFKARDFDSAAKSFDKLLARYADSPLAAEAALMRGQALERLDQADAALAMYAQVAASYAKSSQAPEALLRAARLHEQLEQRRQALDLYARLASEYPKFGRLDEALCSRARLLQQGGRSEEAAELWRRVRSDFPHSRRWPEASYRLAEHALQAKRYDEAERLSADVMVAQADRSTLEKTLYLQGRLAIAREQYAEAVKPLTRLAHDFPESTLAWSARYLIAESYYRRNEAADAAQRYEQLDSEKETVEPRFRAMVRLRRAQCQAQLQEWAKALELARTIALDFPEFRRQHEADYVIGRSLAAQAEFAEARDAYARAIDSPFGSKSETAAMAQWMIGETFFHQENYSAALKEYLRVEILYAYPRWQAAALLQAGKCHEMLNQWPEAAKQYERLLQQFANSEFSAEAKARLAAASERGTAERQAARTNNNSTTD